MRFREMWVIQAYTLFAYFAIYSCRDDLFPIAIRIHRKTVDASRQFQLLQDAVVLGGSGMSPGQGGEIPADAFMATSTSALTPEQNWKQFIEKESRKRYVWALRVRNSCCLTGITALCTAYIILMLKFPYPAT